MPFTDRNQLPSWAIRTTKAWVIHRSSASHNCQKSASHSSGSTLMEILKLKACSESSIQRPNCEMWWRLATQRDACWKCMDRHLLGTSATASQVICVKRCACLSSRSSISTIHHKSHQLMVPTIRSQSTWPRNLYSKSRRRRKGSITNLRDPAITITNAITT